MIFVRGERSYLNILYSRGGKLFYFYRFLMKCYKFFKVFSRAIQLQVIFSFQGYKKGDKKDKRS